MFNTSALVREPSPREAQELVLADRSGAFGVRPAGTAQVVLLAVFGVFFLGAFGSIAATFAAMGGIFRTNGDPLFGAIGSLMAVVPVAVLAIVAWVVHRAHSRRGDWHRLALFARENGLTFRRRSPNPQYPGKIFRGSDAACVNHMYSAEGLFADAGTFSWTTSDSEGNETTHYTNYVAYRLSRPVPHLLLDAKGNNGLFGGMGSGLRKSQRLQLGGVFDQYYDVYAPQGYGPDAYQLLAPDVMDALMREPVPYDFELVDNWLFVYPGSGLPVANPATWGEIERLARGVVGLLDRGAGRYEDARVTAWSATVPGVSGPVPFPTTGVAPPGARLKGGIRPWSIVVFVVAALIFLGNFGLIAYIQGLLR